MFLKACHRCGLIHRLPFLSTGERANCVRCHAVIGEPGLAKRKAQFTAAVAVGALALYFPAMLLPVLRIDRLGFHHESSILVGTIDLLREGSWFVGGVVLVFSILFPLVKLLLLIELTLFRVLDKRHKVFGHRLLEAAGRWSMLDVMLLAFLVMLVKLGNIADFRFGPGVAAFVLCVAMSLIASSTYAPHFIWEDDSDD